MGLPGDADSDGVARDGPCWAVFAVAAGSRRAKRGRRPVVGTCRRDHLRHKRQPEGNLGDQEACRTVEHREACQSFLLVGLADDDGGDEGAVGRQGSPRAP